MKKALKRFLAILFTILVIGTAVSSITCTYYFHLNETALWWSWIVIVFVIDVVFGLYIFYNTKRPDESKVYWLIIIVLLPVLGALLFLLFGWKKVSKFTDSDNNHAKLLSSIFNAKESIKIYSDIFYPSYDTFNALNFEVYKGVKVEIIITEQEKKSKQQYLEYKLEQLLDKKVKLYFTDLHYDQSYIIIDDKQLIIPPRNFNFKNIYSDEKLIISDQTSKYQNDFKYMVIRSSLFNYKNVKFSWIKRVKFSIINIFYSFL